MASDEGGRCLNVKLVQFAPWKRASLGSSRCYVGSCNENVTSTRTILHYSMLVKYKISGMHLCLLGTNDFHKQTKNERFSPAGSRCRQKMKYENFMLSFGRLSQRIATKSVPHVQHDYFSSINQWSHWFVALSLPSFLNLPIIRPVLNVLFSSHRMQLKQKIMRWLASLSFVSIAFDATKMRRLKQALVSIP